MEQRELVAAAHERRQPAPESRLLASDETVDRRVRSIERAERVSQAMQSRGFTGILPTPGPRPVPRAGIALLGLFLLAQLLIVWLW